MITTVHSRTPTLAVNDGRGLPVRRVDYLRKATGAVVETLITRQHHNVQGRLIEHWDPRLFGVAPKPNISNVYSLSGGPLNVDSVDAGWRLNLAGVSGEVLHRWDQHGNHWQTTYDKLLRVTALEENTRPNVERFTYADTMADAGHNLRGQMIEHIDPAGSLKIEGYSLGGQALSETQLFANGQGYRSQRIFSALGVVLDQTDAGNHQQLFRHDIAGQLWQMQLRLDPAGEVQGIITEAHYNAAAQLIEQRAGNGVINTWVYDAADGLLTEQQAGLPGRPRLQHLSYRYDRAGNVLDIDDQTFTPVFFANQRVDGHRAFSYDSLYQLTSASGFETETPQLRPGLPTPVIPTDSGQLYNYTQHYAYDTGGNLNTLRHVRSGNNHTQTMRIDPHSNRAVRWTEGDAEPVFGEHFDAHGNLLLIQSGQPLTWNSRDQLTIARLVERSGGPNDEETYLYSQGQRVSKRLVTQAQSVSHVRQVLYLPGLEIRTLDDTEELHVITLDKVRCLHWVKGKPATIEQDQLRFSLDDHLGSSPLELDRDGALISQEIYYPFGGTAWWAATSQVQADYKTIRYSGKEMDVSGLYYYGARYYAPWLQRWVSADPGGDVDGLNLFAFVGNNPLRYVDPEGGSREENVIVLYSGFISVLGGYAEQTLGQVDNIIHQKNIASSLFKNLLGETFLGVIGYEGGVIGTPLAGSVLPGAPHALQFTDPNALTGGNLGGDVAGALGEPVTSSLGLISALIPQTSKMSIAVIDSALGLPAAANEIKPNGSSIKDEWIHPALNAVLNPEFLMNRVMATWLSIIPGTLNMFARAVEAEDIKNRLDPVKVAKIEAMTAEWKTATEQRWTWAQNAFNALGTDTLNPADVLPNVNHMTPKAMLAPITRAGLQHATTQTLDYISRIQKGIANYKEMGTTDNQFLARHAKKASRK
ncbi:MULTISPECIES: RHS repeat-associated core domain-containing protein [unclassified Pseudomonas]|uniref:RHS repeat-associated core domain-containing protein n=1 Tax=unclassified Pseudomonas TaxID=196821 RepID=UPI002AC94F5E|nr:MULTISPECIES: RHS repeat-associated core domain-containing protein [unclassified Pseudomonas]MEB0045103.1 RHS repeat-associated core domain-containing protein [Pseudomonas sp. Dout3]MEB0095885.1 RHS repeat-associated core domain-containing protein [Pseudomonas sp. DC1.2]WPX57754.1 RHS repeat-associated core domain-containing protein [Pseudomonas sp. DC1.2]